MAMPQRERVTNWCSAIISPTDTSTIMIFLFVTKIPPILYVWDAINCGKCSLWPPRKRIFEVSRMIPIIKPVMAADARGASRSGRYPTRSTIMPTNAVRNMDMRMVSTSTTHPGTMAAAPVPTTLSSKIATPRPM